MKKKSTLIGFALIICLASMAQDEQKVQAIFVKKIIEYSTLNTDKDLEIGIVGNSPVLIHLQTAYAQKKNVRIVKVTSLESVSHLQVIYVPSNEGKNLSMLIKHTLGKNVLIIGETSDMIKKGCQITFFKEDNKLKILVDQKSCEKVNVKLRKELLQLAQVL